MTSKTYEQTTAVIGTCQTLAQRSRRLAPAPALFRFFFSLFCFVTVPFLHNTFPSLRFQRVESRSLERAPPSRGSTESDSACSRPVISARVGSVHLHLIFGRWRERRGCRGQGRVEANGGNSPAHYFLGRQKVNVPVAETVFISSSDLCSLAAWNELLLRGRGRSGSTLAPRRND